MIGPFRCENPGCQQLSENPSDVQEEGEGLLFVRIVERSTNWRLHRIRTRNRYLRSSKLFPKAPNVLKGTVY